MCLKGDNLVFATIKCYQNEELLSKKKQYAILFVSLGIFGCLLFNVVQYNRLVSNELDFKIWDMQTVTLNDYTVEL